MIPKKIHYIWFGGNPLPSEVISYIESWKKYCPDYEIVQWDESNFNVNANVYAKQAYDSKKWAFVSDYARLKVLVEHGGIYMDTDVELVKSLDAFLEHKAFSGFEKIDSIPTAVMGCEPGFELFEEFLNYYDNRSFISKSGEIDLTTNVEIMTRITLEKGLVLNNLMQNIDGFYLYPNDYFCPKDYNTGEINSTKNTHAIHHFASSWITPESAYWHKFEREYASTKGKDALQKLKANPMYRIKKALSIHGKKGFLKRLLEKVKGKK